MELVQIQAKPTAVLFLRFGARERFDSDHLSSSPGLASVSYLLVVTPASLSPQNDLSDSPSLASVDYPLVIVESSAASDGAVSGPGVVSADYEVIVVTAAADDAVSAEPLLVALDYPLVVVTGSFSPSDSSFSIPGLVSVNYA